MNGNLTVERSSSDCHAVLAGAAFAPALDDRHEEAGLPESWARALEAAKQRELEMPMALPPRVVRLGIVEHGCRFGLIAALGWLIASGWLV